MSFSQVPEVIHQPVESEDIQSESGVSTVRACLGVGAAVLAFVVGSSLIDYDVLEKFGLKDGGKSDPAPRAQVTYQGQMAVSASENFRAEVGRGKAVVLTHAKQDYDKKGKLWNGDAVSTNGTTFVRDPREHSKPASLAVTMRYCADGKVTTYADKDEHGVFGPTKEVHFEVGRVAVCDGFLDFKDTAVSSAFDQEGDVPAEFNGAFVSHVVGGVTTTAVAAECPRNELERYLGDDDPNNDTEFEKIAKTNLAKEHKVPYENVKVIKGTIQTTSTETQTELTRDLESYANKVDPKTGKVHPSMSINFGLTSSTAVKDSCYLPAGAVPLKDLTKVGQ